MLLFLSGFAVGAAVSGIITAVIVRHKAQRAQKALKANNLLEFLYY